MNNRKIAAILIAAFAWSVPNAYAQENNPENKHADSASQWKGTRVHVLKANTIVPQKPIARVGILAVDSLVIKNPICVVFSPTIIPPVKMADEGPKADKQNSTANEPFFTKWKDVIAALGMFGALGVSLGALCISIRALRYTGNLFRVTRNGAASQIRESKNLIGITSDTANRQLRGYVGVEDLIFADPHTTLTIKNYGQTPAIARRRKQQQDEKAKKTAAKEKRKAKDSENLSSLTEIREIITNATPSKFNQGVVFWAVIGAFVFGLISALTEVVAVLSALRSWIKW